jgi:hypothetical protein
VSTPGREQWIVVRTGTQPSGSRFDLLNPSERGNPMNSIVYIVGLVVIVIAILSFFGLR